MGTQHMRSSLFFNLNNSHLYRRRAWIVWCIPICSLCARTRLHCALSVDNVILHTNKIRAMDRDIFLYIQITLLLLFSLYLPLSLSPKPQTRAMDRDICLYIQITLLLLFSLYLPLSLSPKPQTRAMDRDICLYIQITLLSLLTIPTPFPFTQTPNQGYGQRHLPLYPNHTPPSLLTIPTPFPSQTPFHPSLGDSRSTTLQTVVLTYMSQRLLPISHGRVLQAVLIRTAVHTRRPILYILTVFSVPRKNQSSVMRPGGRRERSDVPQKRTEQYDTRQQVI